MAKPIAKIRLAQGNVGFYDSLTNIRLTKAAPEAIVYSESNVANIKKAIKEGKVVLKEGSLSSLQIEPIYKREVEIDTAPKTKKIVEKKKPEKIENQPKKDTTVDTTTNDQSQNTTPTEQTPTEQTPTEQTSTESTSTETIHDKSNPVETTETDTPTNETNEPTPEEIIDSSTTEK